MFPSDQVSKSPEEGNHGVPCCPSDCGRVHQQFSNLLWVTAKTFEAMLGQWSGQLRSRRVKDKAINACPQTDEEIGGASGLTRKWIGPYSARTRGKSCLLSEKEVAPNNFMIHKKTSAAFFSLCVDMWCMHNHLVYVWL